MESIKKTEKDLPSVSQHDFNTPKLSIWKTSQEMYFEEYISSVMIYSIYKFIACCASAMYCRSEPYICLLIHKRQLCAEVTQQLSVYLLSAIHSFFWLIKLCWLLATFSSSLATIYLHAILVTGLCLLLTKKSLVGKIFKSLTRTPSKQS